MSLRKHILRLQHKEHLSNAVQDLMEADYTNYVKHINTICGVHRIIKNVERGRLAVLQENVNYNSSV
jgi:hypothetical protein